jgi:hypothetical protein
MSSTSLLSAKIVAATLCFLLWSCSGDQPKASNGEGNASSSLPVNSQSPEADVNACSFFSAADAQQIMGAPMKASPGSRAAKVCMYEEVTTRPNSMGPGRVSLTVNKRGSQAEETTGWARIREVRHLETGQKNVSALNGIGDEAWWDGHIEKGRIGVAGIIARKGNSDFMLDSMVIEYVGSPDAMKSIAKRIAGQLN